ncbi:hypothetical protein [Nonomuraea dietziae]|uniref:hypothetical protein n=1 Tax=Nonomuraea dietziae TaxID=65515 RepID=UPI0033E358C7
MLSVDFSILNVALPEVGAGVGMGLTGLPWITSAYALPAAGFTMAVTLLSVVLVWFGLRPRGERRAAAAAVPAWKEAEKEVAAASD